MTALAVKLRPPPSLPAKKTVRESHRDLPINLRLRPVPKMGAKVPVVVVVNRPLRTSHPRRHPPLQKAVTRVTAKVLEVVAVNHRPPRMWVNQRLPTHHPTSRPQLQKEEKRVVKVPVLVAVVNQRPLIHQ